MVIPGSCMRDFFHLPSSAVHQLPWSSTQLGLCRLQLRAAAVAAAAASSLER